MKRPRRTVITSRRVPHGGRTKLWGYGYTDLAALFGMTEGAVRQAAMADRFDPCSLISIINFREQRLAKGKVTK
jgi:hypothetical protein